MCISYSRLLQLTSELGNGVCEQLSVVCPPKMRSGLFTVAAVDNLDYNPSATTAKVHFMAPAFHLCNILPTYLTEVH